jgi:hypothetical protein
MFVLSHTSPQLPSFAAPAHRNKHLFDSRLGPIDAVFTFVNDTDPVWRSSFEHYSEFAGNNIPVRDGDEPTNRWREWGELQYSMRSLYMHANWVRHIYLVVASNSQIPSWLNRSNERVRIVLHADLFEHDLDSLPTFNSLAIETVLHRIPTLSNHFLYMNNDVFFGRSTPRDTFITEQRYMKFHHWRIYEQRKLLAKPCAALIRPSHGFSSAVKHSVLAFKTLPSLEDRQRWKCSVESFWWDRVLSLKYFEVQRSHWFAHIPHLWERRAMYKIEDVLGQHLDACRRNRFRDPDVDVTMHLQYESLLQAEHREFEWRQKFSKRNSASFAREIVVVDWDSASPAGKKQRDYVWNVFQNNPKLSQATPEYQHRIVKQTFDRFDETLKVKPLFFGIDEDLKLATPELKSIYRQYFSAFMQRHWPLSAPWELKL